MTSAKRPRESAEERGAPLLFENKDYIPHATSVMEAGAMSGVQPTGCERPGARFAPVIRNEEMIRTNLFDLCK